MTNQPEIKFKRKIIIEFPGTDEHSGHNVEDVSNLICME